MKNFLTGLLTLIAIMVFFPSIAVIIGVIFRPFILKRAEVEIAKITAPVSNNFALDFVLGAVIIVAVFLLVKLIIEE